MKRYRVTLAPATRDRLGLRQASLVLVDCDIHSALCEALALVAPGRARAGATGRVAHESEGGRGARAPSAHP